jgi:hypothetical protein
MTKSHYSKVTKRGYSPSALTLDVEKLRLSTATRRKGDSGLDLTYGHPPSRRQKAFVSADGNDDLAYSSRVSVYHPNGRRSFATIHLENDVKERPKRYWTVTKVPDIYIQARGRGPSWTA